MNMLCQLAAMRNPGNMSNADMLLLLLIMFVLATLPVWKAIFIKIFGGGE